MLKAVQFTFLGFAVPIVLGLSGAWLADRAGAVAGLCGGLGLSFFATAYIMGR